MAFRTEQLSIVNYGPYIIDSYEGGGDGDWKSREDIVGAQ
jgi:hypothetical protein